MVVIILALLAFIAYVAITKLGLLVGLAVAATIYLLMPYKP